MHRIYLDISLFDVFVRYPVADDVLQLIHQSIKKFIEIEHKDRHSIPCIELIVVSWLIHVLHQLERLKRYFVNDQ